MDKFLASVSLTGPCRKQWDLLEQSKLFKDTSYSSIAEHSEREKTAASQKNLFRYFISQDAPCYLIEQAHNRTCRYINSFICMCLLTWCIIKAIMKSTHWHINEYVNSQPWEPLWAVQEEAYLLSMKIFVVSWSGLHSHHLLSLSHLYQFFVYNDYLDFCCTYLW